MEKCILLSIRVISLPQGFLQSPDLSCLKSCSRSAQRHHAASAHGPAFICRNAENGFKCIYPHWPSMFSVIKHFHWISVAIGMIAGAEALGNANLYIGKNGSFPAMLLQGLIKLHRRGKGNNIYCQNPKSTFLTSKTCDVESFWNHVYELRFFYLVIGVKYFTSLQYSVGEKTLFCLNKWHKMSVEEG